MQKKASLRTAFIFLLAAFLVAFAAASFIANMDKANSITANSIREEVITVGPTNAIMLPGSSQPLPNEKEGTLSIWTKPPIEVFDQFGDSRKYIVFFNSENKPGLRVVYNIEEQVFEAGMPIMKSPKVDIFDNQPHNIVYTFKQGKGQAMFLDGKQVAMSEFIEATATQITGFIVGTDGVLDEIDIKGVEVIAYDHYVTEEELDLLN